MTESPLTPELDLTGPERPHGIDDPSPKRRSRWRTFAALGAVAVMAAVTAGCYSVTALPSPPQGKATHRLFTKHPRIDACPTWHPPMAYVPSQHDCCRDLPNGTIDQLDWTLQQSNIWYVHGRGEPRIVQNSLGIYTNWYENAFTREYRAPGCLNGRDVIFYIETHPRHRHLRNVKSHNQPYSITTVVGPASSPGHKWGRPPG